MLHRISCRQYHSCIGATTLRRLCELKDGCHNNNDLLNLISYDEIFINTKCKTTDLLIFLTSLQSMAAVVVLQLFHLFGVWLIHPMDVIAVWPSRPASLLMKCKYCQKIFEHGRFYMYKIILKIQVVLRGDFFQLPPIHDELYGDFCRYCLKSNFSNIYFFTELFLIKFTDKVRYFFQMLSQ